MKVAVRKFKQFSFTQYFLILAVLVGFAGISPAEAATGLTYHGRIIKPNGQSLEAASVFFHIQIRSPNTDNCLIYDEQQTLNMSGSKGVFVLTIGEGTRVAPAADGGYSISRLFANRGTLTGLTCSFGNSYAPAIADGRRLQVQFNDGSGWETLPAQSINYVPLAIEAVQIGGYQRDQLLRVADGVTATEFSLANWNELWALITGASSVYSKADGSNFNPAADVGFNNKKAINLADPTAAQDAVTKNYADTRVGGKTADLTGISNVAGDGKVLVWNQALSKWEGALPNDSSKLPLAGGVMSGGINMSTQSLTGVGHVVMAAQGTVYLGKFTTLEENALIAVPLNNTTDRGRTWYNTDTSKMRYWDGTAAHDVASKAYADSIAATAESNAKAYTDGKLVTKNLSVPVIGNDLQSIRWNNTAGNWEYYTPSSSDATKLPLAGGTMSGNIIMGGSSITGLAAPSAGGDAVNKTYADSLITNASVVAAIGYTPVNKAGDTMTGILVLSADPSANMDAATKQYVTSVVGTAGGAFITKDGLTPLVANWDIDGAAGTGFVISGLAAPLAAADAVNKTYADGKLATKNISVPAAPQDGQSIRWNNTAAAWEYFTASVSTGTVSNVSSINSDIGVATGSTTPVLTLNSGTGANQIVKLDGSAKLPAVDGSALTDLNGSNIATGTVADARLSANVALKTYVDAGDAAERTYVDGKLVTKNLAVPTVTEDQKGIKWDNTAGNWVYYSINSGDGSALTNLNASNLASGTVADARLSANVALKSYVDAADLKLITKNLAQPVAGDDLKVIRWNQTTGNFEYSVDSTTDSTKLPLAGGTMTGAITLAADPAAAMQPATKQYADAKLVSKSLAVPSGTEDGKSVRWNQTAGNWEYFTASVSSGTVSQVTSANTDASVATQTTTPVITINTGTAANQIVKLDGSAKLPAVDGSALTQLDGSNIATGTVADARLSANVALKSYVDAADLKLITKNLAQPVAGDDLKVIRWNQTAGQFEYAVDSSTDASKLPLAGGTMTGAITLAADPVAAMQPATKQYSDAKLVSKNLAVPTVAEDQKGIKWDQTAGNWVYYSLNTGDGSAFTNLNASNLASGTVADARLSSNVALKSYVDAADATKLPLAGGTMTGAITLDADPAAAMQPATKQYADAKLVSKALAVPAAGQDGQSVRWNQTSGNWEYFTAGSGSGTVSSVTSANGDATFTNTTTTPQITINTGTGASQIVKLDGSAKLPAVDGSALTALNATSITSGTLADARLSANVALKSYADANILGNALATPVGQAGKSIRWNAGNTAWEYYTPATGDAMTTGKLSQFAATSSAELAGVISDESGTGLLIYGTSPTLTTPTIKAFTLGGSTSGGITMQVAATGAAGTYTWPSATPASNKVLQSDNTGALSWVDASAGSVTQVTSANADIVVATTTSTPLLTLNSGTGANQILKLDASAKLPAVDGSLLTNLHSSILTGDWDINGAAAGGTRSITGLADPAVTDGAATKQYVDAVSSAAAGAYIRKDGTTAFTGEQSMGGYALNGNSTASGNLTLDSTSNAAKGNILIAPTSGNVGIGTATPTFKLEVATTGGLDGIKTSTTGGTGLKAIATSGTAVDAIVTDGIGLQATATIGTAVYGAASGASGYGGYFQNSAGGAALRVAGGTAIFDGNVGIGTSTPSGVLDVRGGLAPANTDGSPIVLAAQSASSGNQFGGAVYLAPGQGSGSGAPHIRQVVLQDMYHTANAPNLSAIDQNNIAVWSLGQPTTGSAELALTNSQFGTGFITFNTTMNERMRIAPSGNVGIGTSGPNELLTVEGTTSLRELASAPAQTANYGKIYVKSSDSKLYFKDSAGVETQLGAGYVSGSTIQAGAGTVAAPSLSFSGDTDTGLYSNGANTIGVSAGNSNIFNFSSAGLVSPTTGGGSVSTANGTAAAPTFSFAGDADTGWYRAAADTLAASTAGAERIRIDSSGNVGIGSTSPGAALTISRNTVAVAPTLNASAETSLHLLAKDNVMNFLQMDAFSNTNWKAPIIDMRRAKGTSAVPANPTTLNVLGSIRGTGWIDTQYVGGAEIYLQASENWTTTSSGAAVSMQVTPKGATSGINVATFGDLNSNSSLVTLGFSGSRNTTAWTTGGTSLNVVSGTVTDTSGSGTIANRTNTAFQVPTFASTNPVTLTDASNIYIAGAPVAGTNTTISNSHALYINSGKSYFGGNVGIGSAPTTNSLTVGTTANNVGVYITAPNTASQSLGLLMDAGTNASDYSMRVRSAASVDQFYIRGDGNVGIGTTSPNRLLEVAGPMRVVASAAPGTPARGDIYVDSTDSKLKYHNGTGWIEAGGYVAGNTIAAAAGNSSVPGFTFNGDLNNGWFAPAADVLAATTNGTERLRIDSSGKVGIGVTPVSEKLEISGGVKIGNSTGTQAGTLRWTGVNFQGYDGSAWYNILPNPPAAGGCDTTQTFNTAGVHSYTVPASYATITVRLWGAGGAGGEFFSGIPAANGGTTTVGSLGLAAGGGSAGANGNGGSAGGPGGVASGGTTNTNGGGGTNGGSGVGLVGSGGNSPSGGTGGAGGEPGSAGQDPGGGGGGGYSSYNSVGGGGAGAGAYTEKTFTTATLPTGTTINDLIVGAGGATQYYGGIGGNGRISITCSTTGTPPVNNRGVLFLNSGAYTSDTNFVFDSSSRLGVGTSTPTEKLTVSGNVLAAAYLYSSDARLKKNIVPLENSLEKLNSLSTVTFDWKKPQSKDADHKQIGLIAQDVVKVYPEAVVKDQDGWLRVNYSALISPVIDGVRELYQKLIGVDKRVQALEAEVARLKEQNQKLNQLEERLKALESARSPAGEK